MLNKNIILFSLLFISIFSLASTNNIKDSLLLVVQSSVGKEKARAQIELAEYLLPIDPHEALSNAESAVKLSIRSVDVNSEISAEIIVANSLAAMQKYDDAEKHLDRALDLASDNNDSLKALVINDWGKVNLKKGQLDRAIHLFMEAMQIRESLGDEPNQILSYINIGVAYRLKQRFDTAMVYYNKALDLSVENEDLKKQAVSLQHIAGTYWSMKMVDSAKAVYLRALAIREKINDKQGKAQTLNSLGIMYRDMSEYQLAIEYHLKSLELKKEFGTKEEIAYTLNNIGSVYLKLNQWDKALEFYERALSIRMQLGNIIDQSSSLDNIGHLYKTQHQYNEALSYYKKALVLREKIKNHQLIALSYNNIGSSFLKMNDYDAALENYYKAQKVAEKSSSPEEIARSYKNIGLIYKDLNAIGESLENFHKAVEHYRAAGNTDSEAHIYNLIGGLYWSDKDFGNALSNYNKALAIREKNNDKRNVAATLRNIGILFKDAGKYDQALEYYDQSLKIYEQIGDNIDKAWLLNNYGNLFKDKKQLNRSIQYYSQSLHLFKAANHSDGISNVNKNIGEVYLMQGNANKAFPYLDESVEIARKIDQIELLQDCSKFYAEALYSKGMYKKAYEYFQLYADLRDSVMNEETLKKFSEIQIKNKLDAKQVEFEQFKVKKEAELLHSQLNNTYWIGLAVVLLIILTFFIIRIRFKAKMSERILMKNSELEEANKCLKISETELKFANNAKNRLFSIVAHDLKNPISTTLGLVDLLYNRFEKYDESKKKLFLEQLYITTNSTSMLLENLLEWSRSQSNKVEFKPSDCNVKKLVDDSFALVTSMAVKENVTLINSISDDCVVNVDRNMLHTVFRNLVTNAVKFSKKGGTVEVYCEKSEGSISFFVKDNGIGMEPQQAAILFDVNTDVKSIGDSENKGTGLGLMLCKEFVEKHGGSIKAESEPNKGSLFSFSLKQE